MNISVIIPFFNDYKSINNGVNSVHSNCIGFSYEIIIVDDGSCIELTYDFIENHQFVKIIRQSNSGVAKARDLGIKLSTGRFIAFLDADDYWLPNKIYVQLDYFKLYPSLNIIGTLTNEKSLYSIIKTHKDKVSWITINKQCFKNYFQPSTVVIRKNILSDIENNFSSFFKSGAEEGIFFNRIISKSPGLLINSVYVDYSNGKSGFGQSGLSKRIYSMEIGELENLTRSYIEGYISSTVFILAIFYSIIKFFRRFILYYVRKLYH